MPHIEGPSAPRQAAARKALAPVRLRKSGVTISPQPPPRGGGSSRSRARQQDAAFQAQVGRQIDRAQKATVDHGVEHIAPYRIRVGRKSINGTTVDPGQIYRTDSFGNTQGTPASGFAKFVRGAPSAASHLLGLPLLEKGASELVHGHISEQDKAEYQRQAEITKRADVGFLKALEPSSIGDIAHGRAPSARHLGEDALFFAPWSRGLRATGEAILAAKEGEAAGEAARASYKAGQGVGDAALKGAKRLLPGERALNRSVARQKLFEHIDAHLPRAHAQAVKRTVDQSIKAMVRNGHARNVEEAVGKIADTRVGEIPDEIKGLYQTVPPHAPPEMPHRLRVKGLPARVYRLIQQGAAYRDWYSRGAKVLADAADRLGISRAQMAAVTAVMSQGANPTFNLRRAVEAIQEFKATGAIDASHYLAGQADKTMHILSSPDTFNWSGLKTNSYFGNFLEELDPTMYRQLFGDTKKVTVDRHMAAMFLGKKSVTEKQYLQVEQILTKVADQLGWQPKEVQAAAWVPWKAARLQDTVAARGFTPGPLGQYMPTAADAYERGQAKYRGTLYQLEEKSLANDTFNPRVAQVTSEANPDPQLWPTLRAAYDKLSPQDQVAYSRLMDKAQAGVFEKVLGLEHAGNREGLGIWRGKGSTGAASHILVGSGPISPELRADMDALTAAQGMAKHQNSVSWGRPVPPAEGQFTGIHWTPPAGTDPVEASATLDQLAGEGNVGFIHAPDGGFYVINFSGDQGANFAIRRLGGEQTDIGWQGGYTIDSRIKGPEDWAPTYQEAIDNHPKANELHAAMAQVRKRVEQIDAHFLGGHIAQIVDKQEAEQLAAAGTHVFHGTTPMHAEEIMHERRLRVGGSHPEAAWTTVNPDTADWYANGFTGSGERQNIVAIPKEKIPMGEGEKPHPLGNYGSPQDILFQGLPENARGAFQLTPDGEKAILYLTERMDVTTVPHELAHLLEHFGLSDADRATVEHWAGPLNSVEAHEKFAQGLEAYIRSGEAPNNLKAEFKVLQPAFHEAYPSVGELPQLSPAVADVYKKLLGHRDGLHAAVYFALRNAAASRALAHAAMRGPDRTDEQATSYLSQISEQARGEGFGTPGGNKPVELRPGETTEETGGALGALVRAGIRDPSGLKAAGMYEKVGATLDNAPRTIGEMEKQQEAARGIARSRKAGSLAAAQADALTSDRPFESFLAAGAARKGMLPKSEFKGFEQLRPHLDDLTLFVGHHPNVRPFEKQRLMEAIARGTFENRMPTQAERKLIAKAFGREAASGFVKALRRGEITVADILNIPRAAMSSGDLSAGLRQGLAALFYKPNIFFEGWTDQLRFAFSEGRYQDAMKMIEEHPNYALADKGKVSFTDIGEDLNAREEHFGSQLAEQLPVVGHFIRGSDRAYTGFLNVLRMNLFDFMVNDAARKGWELDEHALESIGSVVNALTGRGNLPEGLANHRAFLNGMFFSPGLAFSRLNFLGFGGSKGWKMLLPGSWYVSLHPYARREAMKTLMRLTGGLSTILWFAHMAGASVSLDPRNADFGKIRIGNTRFDVAGGFQQWARVISELATGQIVSSTTGRVEHLGGGFAQETRLDAALQFLEGKAAPVPSMAIDLLRGTGFGNQPVSVQNELSQHMVPLAWHDIYDIANSTGAGGGPKMAAFATIPDLLGVGVQNYKGPGPQTHKNTLTLQEQSKQAGMGEPPQSVLDDVKWKSELDAATYAGQKPIDKAKAVIGLFDKRYGTNLEQQVLPQIKTQGQAEALYQALRAKLFPSLEHWQSAVNKVLNSQKGSEPVPQQQKSSAPAPAVTPSQAPPMQEAAYHVPKSRVLAAEHSQGLPPELSSAIQSAAARYGVPAKTLAGIWRIESGSTYPNPAVNSSGYGGLFGTTKWNASTQEQADYAAQTLRHLLDQHNGNMAAALSAYSGGGYTSVPGAGGAVHTGEATGAVLSSGPTPGPQGAANVPDALAQSAEEGLQMLASGQYSPSQLLTSLATQQLSNTVETPGGLHIRFQIPKITGPVGRAARGAIALAQAFLGTPYAWGGESPSGFDCSGLLQYIYAKQGVEIPRTSQQQFHAGTSVPKSRLRPGDAVFFVGSDGTKSDPGHVGIYIGHGKFIEAPHSGATVRISNLAGYPGYVGARRYAQAGRKAA